MADKQRPAMGAINLKAARPRINLRGLDPDGCGCIFLGLGIGGGFIILCAYIGQAVLAWAMHH